MIEPSCGVDRIFLALITSAYSEDVINGEQRSLLKFHPSVAPIKVLTTVPPWWGITPADQVGVFPLVKKDEGIVSIAKSLTQTLKKRYNVFYDVSGQIGRRYRYCSTRESSDPNELHRAGGWMRLAHPFVLRWMWSPSLTSAPQYDTETQRNRSVEYF